MSGEDSKNILPAEKKMRELNNAIVLDHFRNGFSLSLMPPEATHFPPRPIIKKDKEALAFIHNKKPTLSIVD